MSATTPRNIVTGFASTAIFPYNRFVSIDADSTPSLVSDRPNPEITHNQNQPTDSEEALTENIKFTAVEDAATSLNANDCQNTENQIAMPTDTDTTPNECLHPEQQSQLPTTSSSPITEKQDEQHTFCLVSPKEIMPLPSRKSSRKQRKRKRVKSRILTETPERAAIKTVQIEKIKKNQKTARAKRKILKRKPQKQKTKKNRS